MIRIMISFHLICFAIIGICFGEDDKFGGIENEVQEYFRSDPVRLFKQQWAPQRKAYEASIRAALYEQTGHKSMNIYLKAQTVRIPIAAGFLLSDNVVDLLIVNLTLRDIPELILPEVSLHLSENVLQIDTTLRKMFIDAKYICYRNKTTALFNEGAQSLLANSPFSFHQVYNEGEITIMAENCVLEGNALVTLLGYSVNLGYPAFKINDCKFSVEIYNSGFGIGPPVIVPYFSTSQRSQLERLLRKPVVRAVTTLLQGILFSHINTSSIFGSNVMKYRHVQGRIFKKTSDFMIRAIENLNKGTIIKNQGRMTFPDYTLSWTDRLESFPGTTWASLTNLRMYGIDTAYTTNRGGPYKTTQWKISELIVFNRLYVQGVISCNHIENGNVSLQFSAEITDVGVSVTMGIDEEAEVDKKSESKPTYKFAFPNWRPIEFYIFNLEVNDNQRNHAHAFVNGYLMNKLPEWLIAHLSDLFPRAVNGEFDNADLPSPVTPKSDSGPIDSCEAKGYVKKDHLNSDEEKNGISVDGAETTGKSGEITVEGGEPTFKGGETTVKLLLYTKYSTEDVSVEDLNQMVTDEVQSGEDVRNEIR